ncbi:PUA domain protein [Methanomicrobium sp. W14]|uniref:RNA-binding protein n=1 Tax=Methanomicrobium sp. W14 TaxID=2817839 RepID=UPI001AEAEDBE|nr:RNA-binding protein [Methanomicrobium sp. W14]MBP2134265.1 PUA domain protein [Methanomicrobium sp. W14]
MVRIEIKKRYTVRKSKLSEIYRDLKENIGQSSELFKSDRVEIVETTADLAIYLVDRKPYLMEIGGSVFPTLHGAVDRPFPEKRITVDPGAIPFMAKGADLMRPGIVSASDDIKKGKPVIIAEEKHNKPLAIGIALMDTEEMMAAETGKTAKNVHHVGDEIWSLEI